MSETFDFTLSWKPNKGKATITAERDGDIIHVDTFDPNSATARNRYSKTLAGKNCDPKQAESDLLQIASEFESSCNPDSTVSDNPSIGAEVDLSDIHRPERILLPEISGLTVPVFLDGNDRICLLYTSDAADE